MENSQIVVGIGEALWDLLPEGKKIGGAPANFAYHVSQLGLPGIAISAVGRDLLGEELIRQFEQLSLNTEMSVVDYPTGTVLVEVDEVGIPSYNIRQEVAWDNIPFTDALEQLASKTTAVCFGSLAQRSEVSRSTIHRFLDAMPENRETLKIFDINLRQQFYTPELIEESMQRCNVLKINDEELELISGLFDYPAIDFKDKCRMLLEKYDLKILIFTCGVDGSYVFTRGGESFVETPKVEVADTVGAGDSFTAAFTAAYLRGLPMEEAHRHAVKVSAFVCSCQGAMPKLPESLLL